MLPSLLAKEKKAMFGFSRSNPKAPSLEDSLPEGKMTNPDAASLDTLDELTDSKLTKNLTEEQLSEEIVKIEQLRATYELVTNVAGKCFDRCVNKLGTNLDEKENVCMNNCVARYFDMKIFFTNRLVGAASSLSKS